MYAMGLTLANYRLLRKRSNEQSAHIWPSYDDLDKAKNDLQPQDIIVIDRPPEVKVSIQSVCNFVLEGILADPDVKARFLAFSLAGFKNHFVVKIGCDGTGGLKVYFGEDDQGSSLLASALAPIALIASKGRDFADIFRSRRVNASSSHFYLRLKYEKEIKEISQVERDRILSELKDLVPVVIDGIPITIVALCTCVDGKLKAQWSNCPMTHCYVCEAGPLELKLEFHELFLRNPIDRIWFGVSPLHALERSFGWLLKGCCYRDFELYAASEELKAIFVDPREDEMAVSSFKH